MNMKDAMRPVVPENPNRFLGIDMSEPRKARQDAVAQRGLADFGRYASMPDELWKIVEQLGELEFPIDSKGELARKLERSERIVLGDKAIDGKTLAMFLPAYYYPISSVENLAEKIADFYHHRRDARPRTRACTPAELKERVDRLFEEQPHLMEAGARLFLHLSTLTR